MDYTIKHVICERELDQTLDFEKKVFGHPSETNSPAYSRDKWVERMNSPYNDLMLYAESDSIVVGIVFGRLENERSITVGPVAVDESCRKSGIARKMMYLLEERARAHEIYHLGLGAVESAEGFYQKLGYTGTLLIQSEIQSVDELLTLNPGYTVTHKGVYDGTVNQVFLDLPVPDRVLQRKYENNLKGCYTQMVFGKTLQK